MPLTSHRDGARQRVDDHTRGRRARRVVLATFGGTPFHAETARLAVEAAAETGAILLVADVVEVRPGRRGARRAADAAPPEVAAELGAALALAQELGVRAVPMRVAAINPVAALVHVVRSYGAGLVVLAPDPARLRRFGPQSRRRFGELRRALGRHAPCLLWSVGGAAPPRPASHAARAWTSPIVVPGAGFVPAAATPRP